MAQSAIDLCWRATLSVNQTVGQALPLQADAYFTFLKILITRNQAEPANELWRSLIATKLKFSPEQVFPYFDYLIKNQEIDQAEEVWRLLGQINPELQTDPRFNLVADGGFESKYLNGGFGWRDEPLPGGRIIGHQPISQRNPGLANFVYRSGSFGHRGLSICTGST